MREFDRRKFLSRGVRVAAATGIAAVGLRAARTRVSAAAGSPPRARRAGAVRLGAVGTGGRGRELLGTLLSVEGVEVPALCDINAEHLAAAKNIVTAAGQALPEGYGKDEYAFRRLMERDDLDAVIIATPWAWHTPMALYGMKAGKYVAVEVPAAQSIQECWQLVETSERTRNPCMMLENWSFRRDNLAVLNMIRAGLLGEVVHCHCAHSHDCIDHWFFDSHSGQDRWAARYLVERNRDQYPTHQLGPVPSWMNIGCGDYFDYITSTATDCFGINDYFLRRFGAEHPNAKRKYAQGDIVTTVIRTKKGKTIVDNYDMQLPRPYDNRWLIQGTRGLYNEQRNAVYITGLSPQYHQYEPFEPYQQKYDHIWWNSMGQKAAQAGHDGVDYIELALFVEAVRNRSQTPLDVYDSVLMSAIGPLSQQSIAHGSAKVAVPDFTRGRWKTRKPAFAVPS